MISPLSQLTHDSFDAFSLPGPAEERNDRAALMGTTARPTLPALNNIFCLFFPKKNRDFSEEERVKDAKGKVEISLFLIYLLTHMF